MRKPTPVLALPQELLDSIWILLDVGAVHGAASSCKDLRRHFRRFGARDGARAFESAYLTCAAPPAFPARGVAICGNSLVADPRWMSLGRVVYVPQALSPYFLFRVRIAAMRSLELHVGVAATVRGEIREWFVDGAGRAVAKRRCDDGVDGAVAYGYRYGAGERVGLSLGFGGELRFFLGARDLGVAFSGVPRDARPFVRFPTGGVDAASGDAVEVLGGGGAVASVSTGGLRDAPTALEGRVVVQTMGPELDDWLTFKIDEKTATVRFLRKLVARVLSARRSRCDEATLTIHFGPATRAPKLGFVKRAAGKVGTYLRGGFLPAKYGAVRDADLDRPLAAFGLFLHDNGVQSRPVYANVVTDIG